MADTEITQDRPRDDRRGGGAGIKFFVNGVEQVAADRRQTPRQIIKSTGSVPPDQHVLLGEEDARVKLLDSEELIDLKDGAPRRFLVQESSTLYPYTVDQIGSIWGLAAINEAELRRIHKLSEDKVFVLERQDVPDTMIHDSADVALSPDGSERFRTEPRPDVVVKVNEINKVRLKWGWWTGAAIKSAAMEQGVNIRLDFILHLEEPSGGDRVIGDDDRVFVTGGECFDAIDNHEDS